MIANYHTHTKRCRHAQGEDEEYVLAALEKGLQILGFADHTPYPFSGDYYSTFRMFPEEIEGYVNSVLKLREKYAGKLRIFLGLEAEYYPAHFADLQAMLKDYPVDYLLLGQHALGNEQDEYFCGWPTEEEAVLKRYVDQCMEAMNTGCFTYFAHPDLIHFTGDDKRYRSNLRRLCQEAKGCGLPLEINVLGLWSGRHYPDLRFWELAAEEGCSVVIGCDAHAPEHLKRMDAEERAMEIVNRYGLRLLETVTLRRI